MTKIAELKQKGKALAQRIAKLAADPEGRWVTVRGRKVFIGKGESFDDALKKSLGGGKKNAAGPHDGYGGKDRRNYPREKINPVFGPDAAKVGYSPIGERFGESYTGTKSGLIAELNRQKIVAGSPGYRSALSGYDKQQDFKRRTSGQGTVQITPAMRKRAQGATYNRSLLGKSGIRGKRETISQIDARLRAERMKTGK